MWHRVEILTICVIGKTLKYNIKGVASTPNYKHQVNRGKQNKKLSEYLGPQTSKSNIFKTKRDCLDIRCQMDCKERRCM